ncbi:hypothetical protein [Demequina aurantiaca]|uniref:hypothetical protein n=1 Tax=Demequina aurantiaca TaxID=676200 RepID=UPI000780245F|nr:hypothetical protein [Demequina aurantiaca]
MVLALIAAVTVTAVIVGPDLWHRYGDRVFSSRCSVTVGDETASLTAEQTDNAALIAAVSVERGLPARAATIGIATAIQESSLRNIDYGDRDSVGLFQQRPSQGWGEVEEILDPYYSANKFYDGLIKVSGWQDMAVTVAAQAVQRSGFPDAYADHEAEARLWASALTGNGGRVNCDIGDAEPTTARAFIERVDLDFGPGAYAVEVLDVNSDTTVLGLSPGDGESAQTPLLSAQSMREWAVAVSSVQSIIESSYDGKGWLREEGLVDDAPAEDSPAADFDGAIVTIRTAST